MELKKIYESIVGELDKISGNKGRYVLPILISLVIIGGYMVLKQSDSLKGSSGLMYRCVGATLQRYDSSIGTWIDIVTCGGALQVCDAESAKCVTIECNVDTDCNDYDINTINKCINPGTKDAECVFERKYKQAHPH